MVSLTKKIGNSGESVTLTLESNHITEHYGKFNFSSKEREKLKDLDKRLKTLERLKNRQIKKRELIEENGSEFSEETQSLYLEIQQAIEKAEKWDSIVDEGIKEIMRRYRHLQKQLFQLTQKGDKE